ncbi:MAG: DUF3990 domain-containing protein [Dysgonamonadaceae bacterium]|jgi:hypothetical protein|nr:DUF3990 domain-containing protein [Dysgonamonadaceae bacterium]
MRVFHGSDTFVRIIDLSKCKLGRDFGQGFYVTKFYQQAEAMAYRVAKWSGKEPVITEFDFDEIAYEDDDLKLLSFDTYDEMWLDFIILNRKNKLRKQVHNYDIIEGPVADDAVSIRIIDYLKNKVTKKDFLDELKFKKPSHQLCFCTFQSLQTLAIAVDSIADDIYHVDDLIMRQLMIDFELSDIRAGELYFNSNVYSQLIEEKTGFYQKSWMEIYKAIIKELKLEK